MNPIHVVTVLWFLDDELIDTKMFAFPPSRSVRKGKLYVEGRVEIHPDFVVMSHQRVREYGLANQT